MTRLIFLASALLLAGHLSAASVSVVNQTPPGSSVPGTTTPSTVPQTTNQANQQNQKQGQSLLGKLPSNGVKAGPPPKKEKLAPKEEALHIEEPTYTFPGLLAKIGRRWIGNDYLYDLPRNIGVKVEIILEQGKEISIDREALQAMVSNIFQHFEIVPESLASIDRPPLPFFHVLIFAFPTECADVAYVSGRLFEEAKLSRFELEPLGTWQVISWEKQDLVITSPLQFDEQLKKSVANIAESFVLKVAAYAKIQEEAQSDIKIYHPKAIPAPPTPKMPPLSELMQPPPQQPSVPQQTSASQQLSTLQQPTVPPASGEQPAAQPLMLDQLKK